MRTLYIKKQRLSGVPCLCRLVIPFKSFELDYVHLMFAKRLCSRLLGYSPVRRHVLCLLW